MQKYDTMKEQPTLRSKKQRASLACTLPSREEEKPAKQD